MFRGEAPTVIQEYKLIRKLSAQNLDRQNGYPVFCLQSIQENKPLCIYPVISFFTLSFACFFPPSFVLSLLSFVLNLPTFFFVIFYYSFFPLCTYSIFIISFLLFCLLSYSCLFLPPFIAWSIALCQLAVFTLSFCHSGYLFALQDHK